MPDEQSALDPQKTEHISPEVELTPGGNGSTSADGRQRSGKPNHGRRRKPASQRIKRLFADLEYEQIDPGAPGWASDAIPEPRGIPSTSIPVSETETSLPEESTIAELCSPDGEVEITPTGLPSGQEETSAPPTPGPNIEESPAGELLADEPVTPSEGFEEPVSPKAPSVAPLSPSRLTSIDYSGIQSITYRKPVDDGDSRLEPDQFLPASETLTPIGWESLQVGEPVVQSASGDQPAMLTYARPVGKGGIDQISLEEFGNQNAQARAAKSLLLEVLDENPERAWSEDELMLVEQVTDQLSLALENAHLHQETRRQLQEQIALRQAAAVLSSALDTDTILNSLTEQMCRAIDATSAYISTYNTEAFESSVITEYFSPDANPREMQSDLGQTYTEERDYKFRDSIRSGQHTITHMDDPDLSVQEREYMQQYGAISILYIPLMIQDKLLGFTELWDSRQRREFTVEEINLCQDIARQAAVAIERAQLFEQTQSALSSLEISERYQKGVAQAVSVLTERGIPALSEVLRILGQAAQASRVSYMETQVDQSGAYWRIIAEWCAESIPSQLGNPNMRRLPTSLLSPHLDDLRNLGYISLQTQSAAPQDMELLEKVSARSMLQLSVPGRHDTPGCLGFDQIDYDRQWIEDEIAALQTAASALANTIAREDLFTQVQINLAETEALYQASANLNSAAGYQEILAVLRRHTILGHTNLSNISVNLFDRPWTEQDKPDRVIPVAQWSLNPSQDETSEHSSLSDWETLEALIDPDRPTVVMDVAKDHRLDERVRAVYLDQMGARSLVYIPLNVTGRWIGHIVAVYQQTTGFPEQEIRRLTSLAGQAAVAIEGLRLLDETRERNVELATLNQITGAAGRTLELDEVLAEILNRILLTISYEGGLISIADPVTHELHLAVHENLPEGMTNRLREQGLANTSCDLVYQLGRTIHVEDLNEIPGNLDPWRHVFDGPISIGFRSYLGVPLVSKGIKLGTVCVFDRSPRTLSPSRFDLMEAIGPQVGVLVDNARLFQETQLALTETETLYQASAQFQIASSFGEILDTLRQYTVLGQGSYIVSIDLYDQPWIINPQDQTSMPEWATVIARWGSLSPGLTNDRYMMHTFPSLETMLNAYTATVIEDVRDDTQIDENLRAMYTDLYQVKSAIFAPLVVGGQWIGHVNALYQDRTKFLDEEIRRLTALTGQAAVVIQNLRSLEESQRRANQLQTAAEIARDTSSTLALEALLGRSVNLLCERFGYYHASIFLLNELNTEAIVHESTGSAGEEMKRRGHRLPVGSRSVIGQVTMTGKPLVLNDVSQEKARSIHQPNPLLPLTRAELGIPLLIGDRVIGALDVQSTCTNAFTNDDIIVLQTLVDQIAVAIDNARSYEVAQTAVEEIREADRLKSQFLANMSHELRTPLNSIIGFSRVILKGIDGPISELQQQDLTAIYNSGQHLLGLINDVLDLSKIEAGKMELGFEENVNIADIIKGVMSTTVGLVKDKSIELQQVIDPDIPELRIDPMKVRQVLLNLLANAAKFTEKGSITVETELQTGLNNEPEVVISVVDTGPGIAPEDQVKLFQPFSQVDGSLTRKTGGSGLGLSICHHLVRLHGGRIGLKSQVGKGTTFYFTLPVHGPEEPVEVGQSIQPELPDVEGYKPNPPIPSARPLFPGDTVTQPIPRISNIADIVDKVYGDEVPEGFELYRMGTSSSKAEPAEAISLTAPQEKILESGDLATQESAIETPESALTSALEPPVDPVIDKEEILRTVLAIDKDSQVIDLYKRYLANNKISVVTLTELDQAVSVARGIQPFAITLDIAMQSSQDPPGGGYDGWQTLKALKTDPGTRNIPVIVCTILDSKNRAYRLGADDYLLKPILEDDLAQAIQRLME